MTPRRNEIASAVPSRMTSAQKAAIILASLGAEVAGPVLQAIGDRGLTAFVDAIGRLKSVPAAIRQQVVIEFISEVERRKGALPGGAEEARRILAAIGDEARIARILGDQASAPDSGSEASVWERLKAAPEAAFVEYLASLPAPAAALILRQLPFEKIAALMSVAEPAAAKEIMTALSRENAVGFELIKALGEAVETDFLKPFEKKPQKPKVSEIANEVVGLLPASRRDELLRHLESQDPEVAAAIRAALVTFEDLPDKLDEAGAAALLRGVDKPTLLAAFVFGRKNAPQTVDFLLANVSKRMAEQYAEEMKEMAEVDEAEGEAAQRKICSETRRLLRSGEISPKKKA